MYNETLGRICAIRRVLRLQPDVPAAVRDGLARHAAPLLGLRPAVPDLPPALDDRRVRPRHLDLHRRVVYARSRRFKNGKHAPRNPWGGSSLEWQAPTPPTLYNFEKPPVLHELYNYDDLVEVEEDVLGAPRAVDAGESATRPPATRRRQGQGVAQVHEGRRGRPASPSPPASRSSSQASSEARRPGDGEPRRRGRARRQGRRRSDKEDDK